MSVPRRIVVATDFSPDADRAAAAATDWAERFDAELHWAHAVEHLPSWTPPSAAPLVTSYVERARKYGTTHLAAAAAAAEKRGVTSEAHLVDAPAASGVVELARSLEADCVVVGSRGHTVLHNLALGSVAERIVHEAACRVLVVRGERSPGAPGTIVLGEDLTDRAAAARRDALALAEAFGAKIDLVHGFDLGVPWFSSLAFALPDEMFEDLRAEASAKLDAQIGQSAAGVELSKVIVHEPPAAAICAHAEQVGAGLVVVGTHALAGIERVFLGSVADRVLRQASCSVLVSR